MRYKNENNYQTSKSIYYSANDLKMANQLSRMLKWQII